MKIEKVTYNKPFIIGPYMQEKVGFEATLEDGENPKDALTKLKAIAEEWHKESNPGLHLEMNHDMVAEIQAEKSPAPDKRINTLVDDIRSCTELKVLESYRILAKTKPELQAAYDEMIEKLTPKQ